MAKNDPHQEDHWIKVCGKILDTNGNAIEGVRGALLYGYKIEKTFVCSSVGDFSVEGQGVTHVGFGRAFATPTAAYVLQSEEAAVLLPDDCGQELTMPTLHYRQLSGEGTALRNRKRRLEPPALLRERNAVFA